MQNFAEQCADIVRLILVHNLDFINEDGSIRPIGQEELVGDEAAHLAFALGEYYRLTHEVNLSSRHVIDLVAKAIAYQVGSMYKGKDTDWGSYVALALLSFGAVRERNPVWERLDDEVRTQLDHLLLRRDELKEYHFANAIGKAVVRHEFRLTKKDETGKLIDRFLEYCEQHSTGGFFDATNGHGLGGTFDVQGVFNFSFIRQALYYHTDNFFVEKKLPSLRTYAEKYLRLIPDLMREDGTCWAYGNGLGAHGQMYCISMVLQALRDGWITPDKQALYINIVFDLFQKFFCHYVDQEHGYVVICDSERMSGTEKSSIRANFDAVCHLCQWARLARRSSINVSHIRRVFNFKAGNRLVIFDKGLKRENGLFVYRDGKTAMNLQLPLVSGNGCGSSDFLAFPHCPGIFDWPAEKYLPILQPELTVEGKRYIPSFYGKKLSTGLGSKGSIIFSYEQPEWVTVEEEITAGLGSCRVLWTFGEGKIISEFTYMVKNPVRVERISYMVALSAPHSVYGSNNLALGEGNLGIFVEHDDLMLSWQGIREVEGDRNYRTHYGKIHYIQELSRDYPLVMQPGQPYRLVVSFTPDVVKI
ncbi:MAG: hypothetical protein LBN94_01390 [Puniceicoccales bacterium]|jgi:hypothetical protein|nr:hypothetical protein [Puniceicoccales bacterium]